VLGRPGTLVIDGAVRGTWRARLTGRTLTVRVNAWETLPTRVAAQVRDQAERLAVLRGAAGAQVLVD
ncbi:crosslink repair DNA glycosylase YcaQ family protein, partial [Georgenia sp. 10Sc9-8]|nr:crosslink repair DNA glycosylase YcaQ family protein [Georgenia halotolerans]